MMKQFLKLVVMMTVMLCMGIGLNANGLNLNSIGSKALAMGGAFVGLADDFSAIFWNPAGMTQMKKPLLGLFLTDVIPSGTYQFDMAYVDAETETSHYISGALGFYKPISEKVTIGILAHVPSASGSHWDGADLRYLTSGIAFNWKSLVALATVSPAIAVKVSEKLSLGASLNIYYGFLRMERPLPGLGQFEEDVDGLAVGGTLGIMYQPSEKVSFGLTFKTPVSAKFSGDSTIPALGLYGLPTTVEGEREATWPLWIGFGIAVKPSDKLTITADVQYTNWKEMTSIPVTFDNAQWSAVVGENADYELKWKDTLQLRLGIEYKISSPFALRFGYYYDPDPTDNPTQNILLPEITYHWITLGFGYQTENISLDVGFEHGFGQEVDVSVLEIDSRSGMPGKHGMNISVPTLSLSIRF
jgi:long-chain fatty acid transport protein